MTKIQQLLTHVVDQKKHWPKGSRQVYQVIIIIIFFIKENMGVFVIYKSGSVK